MHQPYAHQPGNMRHVDGRGQPRLQFAVWSTAATVHQDAALYPRTVPRLTHQSGQPNAGVVDQSGRNIIASRDSREAIPAACLSPSASAPAPATLFRTLLHPAAPGPHACTRTFCTLHHAAAPCTLHLATQRRPSNRGPMSLPSTPPKILACIYTSTEPSTVPQYSTVRPVGILCLDMGLGPWTEPGRVRPSPLRDNHDLPWPALHRSLPWAIPWSDPDQAQHHGHPASHPSSHPSSTVGCDDHRPLRGAGQHLDAGTQPTNYCPAC